jgi:hypothetical protein
MKMRSIVQLNFIWRAASGVLLLALGAMGSATMGQMPYRAVAISDQPAPGTNTVFRLFNPPSINASGRVAFRAHAPDLTGIFTDATGPLANVAHGGSTVPGAGGQFYNFDGVGVGINAAGHIVFRGFYEGGSQTGIFTNAPGVLTDVARTNAARAIVAPFTALGRPAINDTATVAFAATFAGGSGIFTSGAASLQSVVVTGETIVPGTAFPFTSVADPAINSQGQLAFVGGFNGALQSGAFTASPGVASVAIAGSTAPGTGSNFQSFGVNMGLNDAGAVALLGAYGPIGNSSGGIFGNSSGVLSPIALRDGTAPGTSSSFSNFFGEPVLNANGEVAFNATHHGNGGRGIFSNAGGQLHKVALVEEPAPGAGASFSSMDDSPAFNDRGQVAFLARVGGNRTGLWASDPQGQLHLVAIENAMWDLDGVPGGDSRRVVGIEMLRGSASGQDGRAYCFNNAGELAFLLHLDGDFRGFDGVYVARVPEPGAAALCAIAIFCAGARRRRAGCARSARRV